MAVRIHCAAQAGGTAMQAKTCTAQTNPLLKRHLGTPNPSKHAESHIMPQPANFAGKTSARWKEGTEHPQKDA
jgi:hypothetical protein